MIVESFFLMLSAQSPYLALFLFYTIVISTIAAVSASPIKLYRSKSSLTQEAIPKQFGGCDFNWG